MSSYTVLLLLALCALVARSVDPICEAAAFQTEAACAAASSTTGYSCQWCPLTSACISPVTMTSLWHASAYNTNTDYYSWWYAIEAQQNYDIGYSNGALKTTLTLVDSPATLTFWEYKQTESMTSYDIGTVAISTDGGSTYTTIMTENNPNVGWTQQTLDITAYVGQTIVLRFYFDTVDGAANDYLGWFIQGVELNGVKIMEGCLTCPQATTQPWCDSYSACSWCGGTCKAAAVLDAHALLAPPALAVSWVDSGTVSGQKDMKFDITLPVATSARTVTTTQFLSNNGGTPALDNSQLPWTSAGCGLYTLTTDLATLVQRGAPAISSDSSYYYYDWIIRFTWTEAVTPYKRTPTTDRTQTANFPIRLTVDKVKAVNTDVSVEVPTAISAIIDRSSITTTATEITVNIDYITKTVGDVIVDTTTTIPTATALASSQFVSVSAPASIASADSGRQITWRSKITLLPTACSFGSGDGFDVVVTLISSDSANPLTPVPVTIHFTIPSSESWCRVEETLALSGVQSSYLDTSGFDGDETHKTGKFWINDDLFVKTAWTTPTSLEVASVTIDKVEISGTALNTATVGGTKLDIIGVSEFQYSSTYTSHSSCSVGGCFSFKTTAGDFLINDGQQHTLNIATSVTVTYKNVGVKRQAPHTVTQTVNSWVILAGDVTEKSPETAVGRLAPAPAAAVQIEYRIPAMVLAGFVALAAVATVSFAFSAVLVIRKMLSGRN